MQVECQCSQISFSFKFLINLSEILIRFSQFYLGYRINHLFMKIRCKQAKCAIKAKKLQEINIKGGSSFKILLKNIEN